MSNIEKLGAALASLAIVAFVATTIWISYGVWNECRDAGFSFFYCLRMVSR